MEGLASQGMSGPMMTYGDGKSNTVKHYYAGSIKKSKKKKEK